MATKQIDQGQILAYARVHGAKQASVKYKLPVHVIYRWRHRLKNKQAKAAKGNGAGGGKTFEEGSTERMAHALRWLGQWKSAQLKHIRAGQEDTSYDIFAEHAFRVLKGEE